MLHTYHHDDDRTDNPHGDATIERATRGAVHLRGPGGVRSKRVFVRADEQNDRKGVFAGRSDFYGHALSRSVTLSPPIVCCVSDLLRTR